LKKKKMMAGAAVAVPLVGLSAAAAPAAMAIGNDQGTTSVNGNDGQQAFGNSVTQGDHSPQAQLVQGSLNKACVCLRPRPTWFARRRRPGRGPGRQRPALAAEPAVRRELHAGQG
jgi:hypothetical protein